MNKKIILIKNKQKKNNYKQLKKNKQINDYFAMSRQQQLNKI